MLSLNPPTYKSPLSQHTQKFEQSVDTLQTTSRLTCMTMHERRPLWGEFTSSAEILRPDRGLCPCKMACSPRRLNRVHNHRSQNTLEEESHNER